MVFFSPSVRASPPIPWQDWSDTVFDRARAEGRLVLLDLGAVWCHWCHVMEETTYKDPEVVSLIQTRFVAVRVDQDARPDLLLRAREGDRDAERRARQTLTAALNLIDPVWGGVYQYSTAATGCTRISRRSWSSRRRTCALRAGVRAWGDPALLDAAAHRQVLQDFLPAPRARSTSARTRTWCAGSTARSTSRRTTRGGRRGHPGVDKHQYARENGWAIRGLVA